MPYKNFNITFYFPQNKLLCVDYRAIDQSERKKIANASARVRILLFFFSNY